MLVGGQGRATSHRPRLQLGAAGGVDDAGVHIPHQLPEGQTYFEDSRYALSLLTPIHITRTHSIQVYVIYVLDWVQTGSATFDAFNWFVYGWGSIPRLYELYSGFLNVPILSSTIGALVQVIIFIAQRGIPLTSLTTQIFFGWRIFTISQSRVTFGVVIVLALFQLGGGLGTGYYVSLELLEWTATVS